MGTRHPTDLFVTHTEPHAGRCSESDLSARESAPLSFAVLAAALDRPPSCTALSDDVAALCRPFLVVPKAAVDATVAAYLAAGHLTLDHGSPTLTTLGCTRLGQYVTLGLNDAPAPAQPLVEHLRIALASVLTDPDRLALGRAIARDRLRWLDARRDALGAIRPGATVVRTVLERDTATTAAPGTPSQFDIGKFLPIG